MTKEKDTQNFYDQYWPKNIPDYRKTKEHIDTLLPGGRIGIALDAGSGTGVCSLALASSAERVVSIDLSLECLKTEDSLKKGLLLKNIDLINASLLEVPVKDSSFDLILSWGVIHHSVDPEKVFKELTRVLKKDGYLIVAVYLRTRLSLIHETIRKICISIKSKIFRKCFIRSVALIVRVLEFLGKRTNVRQDNITIDSQVEDWFFVPVKHFYTPNELKEIFEKNNLTFELLCGQTGRLKSSSNIIARGIKK